MKIGFGSRSKNYGYGSQRRRKSYKRTWGVRQTKTPDEKKSVKEKDQRLDAIYDDGPLGFEKDPVESNMKILAQDPLEEVDLGSGTVKRPMYVSLNLSPGIKAEVIQLLKEYKDCFSWDYDEMPGLSRDLVEL